MPLYKIINNNVKLCDLTTQMCFIEQIIKTFYIILSSNCYAFVFHIKI